MKIETQNHGGLCVLVPHGPVVAPELPSLRETLSRQAGAGGRGFVIDMRDVPYIDSAGIETLLSLVPARGTGSRPVLAQLSETCREALDLTDALSRLDVFDTVDGALKSLRG